MAEDNDKLNPIQVDRALTIEGLPALVKALAGELKGAGCGARLVVATGEVNLPLIQLICAAHRSAQQADKALVVDWQLPQAVGALLREAGFARHVACPRSANGECFWLQEHWS